MWIGWLVIVRLPKRMRTRSPLRTTSGSMPGKTRLLKVHRLKSSIVLTFGRVAAGLDVVGVQHEDEVAVDLGMLAGPSGG